MASYRRGHRRRIPFWTYAGWSSVEPANAAEAVSRETETEPAPTPAGTPAQPEQPAPEPTPSE